MTFTTSDSGAVTVDWVVLTAGLVGLGLATMAVVSTGVQDVSEDIEDQLQSDMIQTAFAPSNASIVEDWQHNGCPAGMDAALEFTAAHFALGDPDTASYDWDPGSEASITSDYEAMDNAALTANLNAWRSDYDTRPELFTLNHSNDVEYAIVECVAAARGL